MWFDMNPTTRHGLNLSLSLYIYIYMTLSHQNEYMWPTKNTHRRNENIFMNTGTSKSKDVKKVMDDLLKRDPYCF